MKSIKSADQIYMSIYFKFNIFRIAKFKELMETNCSDSEINLFLQENLLFFLVVIADSGCVLRKQTNHKIDFGVKQVSDSNFISICMFFILHLGVLFPSRKLGKICMRERYLYHIYVSIIVWKVSWLLKIEQVFTACEWKQYPNP